MRAVSEMETLQRWYASQCDGVWEHQYGISIWTLDNPGWAVDVDLGSKMLEAANFKEINEARTATDWVFCSVQEGKFSGRGGPLNLAEILGAFNAFVGSHRP